MKKVLFASTALVAFTGAAAADVTLSGRAEMGIYNPFVAAPGANSGWQFFTDIDVTFTMSGETDNGLTFGASVDLDEVALVPLLLRTTLTMAARQSSYPVLSVQLQWATQTALLIGL